MSRYRQLIALTLLAAVPGPLAARAQPYLPANPFHRAAPFGNSTAAIPPDPAAEYFHDGGWPPAPQTEIETAPHPTELGPPADNLDVHPLIDSDSLEQDALEPDLFHESGSPPLSYRPIVSWLNLRHSYTHGRHVGLGGPLVGSSWLNRPYYFGADLGTLWMLNGPENSVDGDTDAFGGIFLGADWDHYWGNELAFHWATPELVNRRAPASPRNESLFIWSYSLMYYPWGDSKIRPYWRWGIGNTKFDFPLDDGSQHDEWLLTFPIGMGVKYPVRRWLAARAELTDQLAVGGNGVPTQNNLTLTFGLEWRFGARPRSYWPWHPSRHIW